VNHSSLPEIGLYSKNTTTPGVNKVTNVTFPKNKLENTVPTLQFLLGDTCFRYQSFAHVEQQDRQQRININPQANRQPSDRVSLLEIQVLLVSRYPLPPDSVCESDNLSAG
jgi:hypothetical protein